MKTVNETLLPGLCSVSFRELAVVDLARLAAEAGLVAIEWGGDIHVPVGDLTHARAVARISREHGLRCVSYGSYWRAGATNAPPITEVLATAQALGAPVVRIWAGEVDGRFASLANRRSVADALLRAADVAADYGIRLSLESHDGTLTSTAASTVLLLGQEASHPALGCHWQPPHAETDEVCLASLAAVAPWLEHLHVFHWWPSSTERRPLAEGFARWSRFLATAARRHVGQAALLEFVPADDSAILSREAACLRHMLAGNKGWPDSGSPS